MLLLKCNDKIRQHFIHPAECGFCFRRIPTIYMTVVIGY